MWSHRRWIALTALVAASAGAAGSLLTAGASGSPGASSFVPITPCRLLDIRPGTDNVGSRSTPLEANETWTVPVWGAQGNCTIPSGTTGISASVAIVNPTAASFLTVFPGGAQRPLSANLNWVAGQPPTPNAVTAALSATGSLSFYNLTGRVDLIVDILGYYEPATSGPAGPAGPPGPAGPAGPAGVSGYQVVVNEQTGNYLAFFGSFTASCPTGKKLLGGGATVKKAEGGYYGLYRILSSGPIGDAWQAVFDLGNPDGDPYVLRVYAICAYVTS